MEVDAAAYRTSNHVDALVFNTRGITVVTSNLTGQVWNGEVVILDPKSLQKKAAFATSTGNAEAVWADNNLLIATDSGAILSYNNSGKSTQVYEEHDDMAVSIALNALSPAQFASASWDTRIKLWDLGKTDSTATLEGHLAPVYSVDFNKKSPALLASASRDQTLKIWDTRTEKSAQQFYLSSPVLSVNWSYHSEHQLAAGEEDGILSIFDTRQAEKAMAVEKNLHRDSIKRVVFSPHAAQLVATGSDDATAAVYNVESKTKVWSFAGHTDYVRGVAWDTENAGSLATGGWDRVVHRHSIRA